VTEQEQEGIPPEDAYPYSFIGENLLARRSAILE